MHQVLHRQLCPECNYNQRGLDAFHKCPECGFQFDPNNDICRAVSHKVHLIPIVVGLTIAVLGGIAPIFIRFRGDFSNADEWHWIAIVAGVLICLGGWDGIFGYRWRYAVIGLDDLHLVRGAERIRVNWSDVRSVTLWPTMVVSVRLARPRRTIRVRGVFETWGHARRFAQSARRRIKESVA